MRFILLYYMNIKWKCIFANISTLSKSRFKLNHGIFAIRTNLLVSIARSLSMNSHLNYPSSAYSPTSVPPLIEERHWTMPYAIDDTGQGPEQFFVFTCIRLQRKYLKILSIRLLDRISIFPQRNTRLRYQNEHDK